MANEKNLIPMNKQTKKKQREIARMGGIASGVAKRQAKTMRETLRLLLDEKDSKGRTYRDLVTIGLLKGAMKGNSNNYRTIVETLGELSSKEASNSNGVLSDLIEAMNNVKKS